MRGFRLDPMNERTSLRRAARLRCETVSLDRYGLLSSTVLDVSRTGVLVRAEGWAQPNEIVLVHLFTDVNELVATAEVTRLVEGRREGDDDLALGLRFTRVSQRRLGAFLARLRGTPPPVPRRTLRRDYATAVQRVASTRGSTIVC